MKHKRPNATRSVANSLQITTLRPHTHCDATFFFFSFFLFFLSFFLSFFLCQFLSFFLRFSFFQLVFVEPESSSMIGFSTTASYTHIHTHTHTHTLTHRERESDGEITFHWAAPTALATHAHYTLHSGVVVPPLRAYLER